MAQDFDLDLRCGRIHARRHGRRGAPLLLCVPGLSANLASFDFIGERIAGEARCAVAVDLRGRGRSEVTGPGTYGWRAHARDVLDVADQLGARSFCIAGHSMGGLVAMAAAAQAADRLQAVVLLDICGVPDPASEAPIAGSVRRLGAVYPSLDDYLGLVRGLGVIEPWSEYWDRYFRYELEEVEGGVRARTDRAAVLEDAAFGAGAFAFGDHAGVYALWPSLTMPVLLARAAREILPGFGYIVTARDRDRFRAEVRSSTVVEIDANHYTVATVPDTVHAIDSFLRAAAA